MAKGVQGIRPPQRRGLTEQVADSIRQAIFSGAFELGDHLNEADIAERLQVSRGPVREALMQLKQEGIVTIEWHRGAYIMELSAKGRRVNCPPCVQSWRCSRSGRRLAPLRRPTST